MNGVSLAAIADEPGRLGESIKREYYRQQFHRGEVSLLPRIAFCFTRGIFVCTDGRWLGAGLDALTAYRNWAIASYPTNQVFARDLLHGRLGLRLS